MADIINKVKLPDNKTYNIEGSVHYVCGTQTAATGAWTGNLNLPALYDGLTIMYYLPWAGSGNATLNLTLSDGSTTGAKNCYYNTSRLTTHYGKGCNIIMTYHPAGSITVDGTATTDDRWIANANYADGNNTYYLSNYYNYFVAGPNKIFPYTIVMQNADGRWESIVTSSSTETSKVRNTHGFRLGQLAYLNANATYAENAKVGDNQISYHKSDLIDHRYSFNTANNSTSGTTTKKTVYLVGAINASDGLFYLDATWWTQTLPTTADGKLYIYLGDAFDYYRMSFVINHPIYRYINGMIREYSQDAATVNGLTVQTAVPANAKFTDDSVTSSAKHYTPATASGQDKTASASGATAAWGIDVVKGVTLNTDGKGHVTGLSVTSGKIPGNPDTDTKVTQTADDSTNSDFECLFSATADNTTRTETSKKSSKLKFNPSAGTLTTRGLEVKGVIAGDSGSTGHGLYGGGGYHNAYNNILLHGDASTGTSGIAFVSDKSSDGTITNVNQPSDRGFIQYHACGITTASAEGTNPTLATSGENGRLVIGIGNDATDQLWLQTPGRTGLIHQVGTASYAIPDTNNTTGTVGSATQPAYVDGGAIKPCTYSINATVPSGAVFTDTKNTAGSTDTSSKIFLIGATSQAANLQTYSDNEVYATSGVLTTKSVQVGGTACTMQFNTTTQSLDFVFA